MIYFILAWIMLIQIFTLWFIASSHSSLVEHHKVTRKHVHKAFKIPDSNLDL